MIGNPPPPAARVLDLVALPADRVRGIYTIGGVPGRMPGRALLLHPDVVDGFMAAAHQLVVSDIFRSAESSLAAVRAGRGARPPGFSAHNFGLAVDLDIKASMRRGGFKTKEILDLAMEQQGFLCHRLDHKITDLKGESHHYNALVDEYATVLASASSTAASIEVRILALYSHAWRTVDPTVAQAQLARLGLYRGDLDGKIGPISKQAIRVCSRSSQCRTKPIISRSRTRCASAAMASRPCFSISATI